MTTKTKILALVETCPELREFLDRMHDGPAMRYFERKKFLEGQLKQLEKDRLKDNEFFNAELFKLLKEKSLLAPDFVLPEDQEIKVCLDPLCVLLTTKKDREPSVGEMLAYLLTQ